jgi:hypothetical protein
VRLAALSLVAAALVTPTSTFPPGPISPTVSHEIARLGGVASTLSGRAVTVNCWSNADWGALIRRESRLGVGAYADAAAFANIGPHQIQVGPPTCATLAAILAHRRTSDLEAATAVGVLAHESRHTSGVRSESAAECGAMQTLPRTARLLGFDAARASRLQHIYRGMVYPTDEPRYRSRSCRAGLPGIVVPNEFGPAAAVAALRARLARATGVVSGWRSLPVPLGSLGTCSAVHSRVHEVARAEELRVSPDGADALDATAVQFDSDASFRAASARLLPSARCFARAGLRRAKLSDPSATVRVGPLPPELRRLAGGVRVATRTRALVVQDQVFLLDPSTRTLVALTFAGHGRAVPLTDELRAVRAAGG